MRPWLLSSWPPGAPRLLCSAAFTEYLDFASFPSCNRFLFVVRLGDVSVEPRAFASLGFISTNDAKFGTASAQSMVIAISNLSCSTAFDAPLPPLASGLCKKLGCFIIPGTLARKVPSAIASHTNLCVASITASSLSIRIAIMVDIDRSNPLSTSS